MGVMDGIKILELARVPPAEMPAMMLADMGADVLKIESADPERPTGEEWVRRTIHAFTNRNKRSITLNMKAAEGQAIRSEEHTSELQSRLHLVCRLLLEKKKKKHNASLHH